MSASNKSFFSKREITQNVKVFLTKWNINTISRSKCWDLFLNNHAIIGFTELKTIVSISAIVKIILNYNTCFYCKYKLWMY